MSIVISNSTATALPATAGSSTSGATTPKPQPAGNNQTDTVQLSKALQMEQLYNQGHAVPQIESSLNLSAQAVNSYLHIAKQSK